MANNQYTFLDYAGLTLFWNKIKKIIEDNESATTIAINNLVTRVDQLTDAARNHIISKTYLELKDLKDTSQLVPGQQYMITDYELVAIIIALAMIVRTIPLMGSVMKTLLETNFGEILLGTVATGTLLEMGA